MQIKSLQSNGILNVKAYIKNGVPQLDIIDLQKNCPHLCQQSQKGDIKIKYGQLIFILLEELKKINIRLNKLEKLNKE